MIGFILNIPYTIFGLVLALISFPRSISFVESPIAFVIHIQSFWWLRVYARHARAMAVGHIVILGPKFEPRDLEHELVHVEQHQRVPLIQPILYFIEMLKNGNSPKNKYEAEAYYKAGNEYKERL